MLSSRNVIDVSTATQRLKQRIMLGERKRKMGRHRHPVKKKKLQMEVSRGGEGTEGETAIRVSSSFQQIVRQLNKNVKMI